MTRVIASLADMGFVDRAPHPVDGRQVLVSASESGAELVRAARRARQEWLAERLATLDGDKRCTLREAADIMLAVVDESP
jgi:DNA-binding MarR family transcriptional regulator